MDALPNSTWRLTPSAANVGKDGPPAIVKVWSMDLMDRDSARRLRSDQTVAE